MKTDAEYLTAQSAESPFLRAFLDQVKCPSSFVNQIECSAGEGPEGFFKLGEMRLYGRTKGGQTASTFMADLPGIDNLVALQNGSVRLPFNPSEIIDNLRLEKYAGSVVGEKGKITDNQSLVRKIYYALRPLFPVRFRRILQRVALQDWAKIPYPSWPIDTTADDLIDWLFKSAIEVSGETEIPFIWYWPRKYTSCAIMTHDVETGEGQEFCYRMLEMEEEYGIKSAFELVPEVRYVVSERVLDAIRAAGSEVCVHGLNHDGRLFSSEELFRNRAKAINQYAEKWGAKGFRSPVMYRNPAWYDAYGFSYDMSFPNVAHLDPQRGGCCTVFPFFIGNVLELPLTTIQDYPLYNIIRQDPIEMWTKQMDAIIAKHGLISFIIHPDYTTTPEKQQLYRQLLGLMKKRSEENDVWLALPGEVDEWWRERNAMNFTRENGKWTIEGKGSENATVGYARIENGQLCLETR
jgi:peptidoglycan/xylan/chitin deacetylase (PgdA/CDA1 family)